MKFIDPSDDLTVSLAPLGGIPDQVHVFQRREVLAVNAALAAGRPLLVRGEPGTGKSQLARAAAKALGRAYVQHVVDGQTEARDLFWHLDSLRRLSEAQLAGALRDQKADEIRDRLKLTKFVSPGVLWWAFDWPDAVEQAKLSEAQAPEQADGGDPARGCVVLIDEIDKAEPEVPNGLLEALGSGALTPPGRDAPVRAGDLPPLVIITTNEERVLPDAFLRRCLVLELALPTSEAELAALLIQRGQAHFPKAVDSVLSAAAEMLVRDRREAQEQQRRPLPGQAEYLDLVRAVLALHPRSPKKQGDALAEIAEFALRKYGAV